MTDMKDESKVNAELDINLKSENAVPQEYFSKKSTESVQELKGTDIIHCEGLVYILKFPSGIVYHGEVKGN